MEKKIYVKPTINSIAIELEDIILVSKLNDNLDIFNFDEEI